MAVAYAEVNPSIISWARLRAELSYEELSKKVGLPRVDKLIKWEEGELMPTFNQAQKLSKAMHIPFGYLFLSTPPENEDVLPIPDLRTIGSEPLGKPSASLIEVVRQVLVKQAWYKDYLIKSGYERNTFVGKASIDDNPLEIVADIKECLGLPKIPKRGSWEDYMRSLVGKIESLNILVMKSGIVGSNTHRPLSVKEFRGFAICDPFAPVIFINSSDSPQARLFTLIHELAHIWLGLSGVTDAKPNSHRKEEKVCNQVAAEFLVPTEEFTSYWEQNQDGNIEKFAFIASKFHVSQWVIARKALDLNFISVKEYNSFTGQIYKDFKKEDTGPINYYMVAKGKYSMTLTKAVISETLSGRTLYRDAGNILGLSPSKIDKFSKELGF